LLNNPNYLQELQEEEMKVVRAYEELYGYYRQENFMEVLSGADRALELYAGDPLVPKFQYIRAMALGSLEGKEAMKVALDTLIAQFPSSEEGLQAREIVDYMYVEFPEIKEADQAAEAELIYSSADSTQEHYFLLALQSSQNVNQVSFDLLNHNLDHFNQYDLSIEQMSSNDSYNILIVKQFNNAEGASRYLSDIERNSSTLVRGVLPAQYRMMIISRENFETLQERKELIPYYLFYQNRYLNQE
jgi:hypothetical protein